LVASNPGRVLPAVPVTSLAAYVESGGGIALERARTLGPRQVIDEIAASGLGGRGGAGFPAGRKWAAVARNRPPGEAASVVVNAAEGEPGSFKDRVIMRHNPYAILEGALVAALAVGADEVMVASKRTFVHELAILDAAVAELQGAGWTDGVSLRVFAGPSEYLYGEETALLEVLDGRHPFPRIAPPYRRGVEELVTSPADVSAGSSSAAHVELAGPDEATDARPTLASNVETYVNAALIVANGPEWWRGVGTPDSPGTIVCTVSGATQRAGAGEFAMGTPLGDVLDELGGGPRDGRTWVGVLSGVSNAFVPADLFRTPVSHEAMRAIGSDVGTGGYIVFDDHDDEVAVAAGVARFLAVESCGQCAACKGDGLELADALTRLARSHAHPDDLDRIRERLTTVADGARCNLATQQQVVVGSILERFADQVDAHARGDEAGVDPEPIAPLREIAEGVAVLETRELAKQPDWTYDPVYSGQWPADRLDDHRQAPHV
jgi:NADH-quinone oxidoreductase subunit F